MLHDLVMLSRKKGPGQFFMENLIGNRIKEIRQDNKFNQKDFAKILGVKPSYISKLEHHKKIPSQMLAKSICTNFMVKEEWLTTGKGKKHIEFSDIRANSLKWLNKLAALADNDDSVSNNKPEITSDASESATVKERVSEIALKESAGIEQMAGAKAIFELMQKIDEIHAMLKTLTAQETENKTLNDQLDKFKEILNKYQPPDGVERRQCRLEYDNHLKSA